MGRSGKAGHKSGTHRDERAARNARSKASINLATELAAVFSAGVYVKEDLQSAICSYVAEMKKAGETGDTVVKTAESLVAEVGASFPASDRMRMILADVLAWCMAEFYRESA
jgi:hypothetical protein